jgi:hypothetical protein
MNISQVISHLYPQTVPLVDFIVRDDGPTPVLRTGMDGRTRYTIRPLEEDETEEVEDVHFYYRVNFNNLAEGVDYDIVDRGPYIAEWNLPVPQPTEAELQAAWEELQALPPEPEPLTLEQQVEKLHAIGEAQKELLLAQENTLKAQAEAINFLLGL